VTQWQRLHCKAAGSIALHGRKVTDWQHSEATLHQRSTAGRVLPRRFPLHGQFARAIGDRFCAEDNRFTLLFTLSSKIRTLA
jgi:hypothetical protein